ncbi:Levansucrase and sucrase synthesis operon antiterminator [Paraliobacillus sp. PM-2]|uniref:PRD domain-containing protein n=1 Tax=Paraliobacillus sp. PM-2 TaxID=1462524 RepID=UPI00061CBE77|nr:PRD domain-containing protein [Paraliobacillus sp. PM-2]CQR46316.1 Levansucrase and sucrase synthesis operon antiterminator [Paraliobacillus sp. PM-2]
MKLKKILNNNAVLVVDGNQEKVAVGTGIAYGKKKNDVINKNKIEKLFVMKENEKLQQLLSRISEEHFIISEEIISYAEQTIGMKLSEHIHITLTDHVSFSIERIQNGMHLKNKLLNEIKILYKEEFEIGLWALKKMKERLDIDMPIDEAAFIALHIHTMKLSGGNYKETVRQTTIVSEMVQVIVDYLGLKIKEDDISYQRLITHLRFVLHRVKHSDQYSMDPEMLTMIKDKFSQSYHCAKEVSEQIAATYHIDFPESELGYIAIHLERLRE